MDIINYLASDNYIIVNKTLIKTFGLNEAVMLGELCTEYRYWAKEARLEDDMFFSTINNIEENTGLTAHEQRQAIKSLENAGVLETVLKGVPAKKYFKLNIDTVVKILTTCSDDFSQQDVKNLHSNNNKNSNNKSNNKSISKDIDTEFEFGKKKEVITKQKKPSLYDKCVNLINDYTDDVILQGLLVASLKLFLENSRESGTPFYTNTFKGKLNNLRKLSDDDYKLRFIVQQTLDNGWNNFYEIKEKEKVKKRTGNFARDVEKLHAGLNEKAEKKGRNNGTQF